MALSQQYIDFVKNLFSSYSGNVAYYAYDDLNNTFGTDGKNYITTQERTFRITGPSSLSVTSPVWSSQFGSNSAMIPTYLENRVNYVEMANIGAKLPSVSSYIGELTDGATVPSTTPVPLDWNTIGPNVLFNPTNAYLISALREGFWIIRYISGAASTTPATYNGLTFMTYVNGGTSVTFELIKINADTGKVIKRFNTTVSEFGNFDPGENSISHGFEMPGLIFIQVGSARFAMVDSEDGTFYGIIVAGSYTDSSQQAAFLYAQRRLIVDMGDAGGGDGSNDPVYINTLPNWQMIEFPAPPISFSVSSASFVSGSTYNITVQKSSAPTQRHWATPDSSVIYTRVELWDGNRWLKVKTSPDNTFSFTVPKDFPKTPDGKIRVSSGYLWANELLFDDKFNVKDAPVITGVIGSPALALPFPSDPTKKENLEYIRTKVNEFRISNGLSNFTWSDQSIVRNITPIMASHWNEVAKAIDEAYRLTLTLYKKPETETIAKATILPNDSFRFPLSDLRQRIDAFKDALEYK